MSNPQYGYPGRVQAVSKPSNTSEEISQGAPYDLIPRFSWRETLFAEFESTCLETLPHLHLHAHFPGKSNKAFGLVHLL